LEASVGCYCLAFARRVWNHFVIIVFVTHSLHVYLHVLTTVGRGGLMYNIEG
jgi:hypothetical protein